MRHLFIFFGVSIFGGLLVGWLISSNVGTGLTQSANQWDGLVTPRSYAQRADTHKEKILRSGHFGALQIEQTPEDTSDVEVSPVIPFPRIIATAQLDGEIEVNLRLRDGTITNARINDELEGGWIIRSVTMELIEAEQDGVVIEFPVYPTTEKDNNN